MREAQDTKNVQVFYYTTLHCETPSTMQSKLCSDHYYTLSALLCRKTFNPSNVGIACGLRSKCLGNCAGDWSIQPRWHSSWLASRCMTLVTDELLPELRRIPDLVTKRSITVDSTILFLGSNIDPSDANFCILVFLARLLRSFPLRRRDQA